MNEAYDRSIRSALDGFYRFLSGEFDSEGLYTWLKAHPQLEPVIGSSVYHELCTYDYTSPATLLSLRERLPQIYEKVSSGSLAREHTRRLLCALRSGQIDVIIFSRQMLLLSAKIKPLIPEALHLLAQELNEFPTIEEAHLWEPGMYWALQVEKRLLVPPVQERINQLADEILQREFPDEDCPVGELISANLLTDLGLV